MSGKKVTPKTKLKAKPKLKMDRRERRTRDALGDALIELMHQRPFKSIKVQDVLDRAGVSRELSTRTIVIRTICFLVTLRSSGR
jgi:hypothetical protein